MIAPITPIPESPIPRRVPSPGDFSVSKTITYQFNDSGNVLSVNEMHFVYDNDPRPAMVKFNGTMYFYLHNLQGDIVGIVDENGSPVVEYKYNAWGKRIEVVASDECKDLEKLNPFTYRGHVWDAETGLYYMRARYYSPEYCRFISPDKIKYSYLYSDLNFARQHRLHHRYFK